MTKTDHRLAIRRSGCGLSRAGRGAAEPVGSRRRRARHQARAHPRQPHRRSRRAARSHRAGEGEIRSLGRSSRANAATRRKRMPAKKLERHPKKLNAWRSNCHPTSSRPATGRARRIPKNSLSRACPYRKTGLQFPGHALARALDGDEVVAMPAAAGAGTACRDRAGNVVAIDLAVRQSLPVFV